jgi:hypothetical protein
MNKNMTAETEATFLFFMMPLLVWDSRFLIPHRQRNSNDPSAGISAPPAGHEAGLEFFAYRV